MWTIRNLIWLLFALALARAVARIAFLSTNQEFLKKTISRSGVSFQLLCTLAYAGMLLYILLTY